MFESGTGTTGDSYVCSLHGILTHALISKVVEFFEVECFMCGMCNIYLFVMKET